MRQSSNRTDVRAADVYVYGLIPQRRPLSAVGEGVTGRPVETMDLGGIVAVVSRDVDSDEFGLAGDLLAHTRVLDSIASGGDVVPLAFGTFLPSSAEEGESQSTLAAAYAAAARRVSGAMQYTLTVRYVQQVALGELVAADPRIARLRDETAGRGEHEARAEKLLLGRLVVDGLEAKAVRDAAHVVAVLGPVTRAISRRERRQADEVVEIAALVERDAADRFTAACEALAEELAGRATVRLLGPQAPYDFVGETDRWGS